ncbi:CsbD family protein [Caenorhabditis elegans]|nr:CsbD family protein [Caenorhabditis elegans]CCD67069.1 CsbD family protein [Caenorhabditis elegans]|eukprot:NP_497501.1 Uncharacterized protein CELE_Y48G9A.7 [Caenorhabditis elegans]
MENKTIQLFGNITGGPIELHSQTGSRRRRDTVENAGKSAWDTAGDVGKSVIDTVENAGAAVKNGASDLDEKLMGSG